MIKVLKYLDKQPNKSEDCKTLREMFGESLVSDMAYGHHSYINQTNQDTYTLSAIGKEYLRKRKSENVTQAVVVLTLVISVIGLFVSIFR